MDTTRQIPGITTQIEQISPAVAAEYLKQNTHNRTMRVRKVKAFARDMAAGQWYLTGNAIQFSDEGVLLDGQQRLTAVIEANITVPMLVMRGLPAETQAVLDTGSSRRFYDVLSLRGQKSSTVIAAALSIVHRLRIGPTTLWGDSPSHRELDELWHRHRGISDSIRWVKPCRPFLNPGPATAFHYLFSQQDTAKADDFFTGLAEGIGLTNRNPVYALRERMIRLKADRKPVDRVEVWALTIKAWNAFMAGKSLSTTGLRWVRGGDSPEPFPQIYGRRGKRDALTFDD